MKQIQIPEIWFDFSAEGAPQAFCAFVQEDLYESMGRIERRATRGPQIAMISENGQKFAFVAYSNRIEDGVKIELSALMPVGPIPRKGKGHDKRLRWSRQ